jgi:hypothetical protein
MSLGKQTLVVALSRSLFQIEARAESALAGTGENTGPNFGVRSHPRADIYNFSPHLLINRVQNLRTIQRNVTNLISHVIENGLVTHDRPSYSTSAAVNDQRICLTDYTGVLPLPLCPIAFIISNVPGTLNGVKRPCQFRISDVGD